MSYLEGKYGIEDLLFNLSDDAHDYPHRRKSIGELFQTLAVGAFHKGDKEMQEVLDDLIKRLAQEEED